MHLTRTIITKYLAFFHAEADRLLSAHDLDAPELETLKQEFHRFLESVRAQSNLDREFIARLEQIEFTPRKNARRSTSDNYIRWLGFVFPFRLDTMFGAEAVRKSDIRDTIVTFRDHISHLLFAVNQFRFPEN